MRKKTNKPKSEQTIRQTALIKPKTLSLIQNYTAKNGSTISWVINRALEEFFAHAK